MLGDSTSSFGMAEVCLSEDVGDAEVGLDDAATRMFRVSTVVFIMRDGGGVDDDDDDEVEAVAIPAFVCIKL